MLHKNVSSSLRSGSTAVNRSTSEARESNEQPDLAPVSRLRLVPPDGGNPVRALSPATFDFLGIAAGRCSSFLAEAAVLVLVLALLDRFMLKGRLEAGWVVSALVLSVVLLAGSILTDFSARRWLR